jgi:hypothetical protein
MTTGNPSFASPPYTTPAAAALWAGGPESTGEAAAPSGNAKIAVADAMTEAIHARVGDTLDVLMDVPPMKWNVGNPPHPNGTPREARPSHAADQGARCVIDA